MENNSFKWSELGWIAEVWLFAQWFGSESFPNQVPGDHSDGLLVIEESRSPFSCDSTYSAPGTRGWPQAQESQGPRLFRRAVTKPMTLCFTGTQVLVRLQYGWSLGRITPGFVLFSWNPCGLHFSNCKSWGTRSFWQANFRSRDERIC